MFFRVPSLIYVITENNKSKRIVWHIWIVGKDNHAVIVLKKQFD